MACGVTDAPRQLPYCAILTIAVAFSFNSTLAAIALFVILRLWRVPVNIPGREKLIGITMGAFLAFYSYGVLGAIEHLPVALVILTFYLYPKLTGVGAWLTATKPSAPSSRSRCPPPSPGWHWPSTCSGKA